LAYSFFQAIKNNPRAMTPILNTPSEKTPILNSPTEIIPTENNPAEKIPAENAFNTGMNGGGLVLGSWFLVLGFQPNL